MAKTLQLKFDPDQDYQLEAIRSVVDVFEGLPRHTSEFALGDEVVANLPRYEWRGAPFASWLYRIAAKGAEIVTEIHDADYGGRFFSCRDLEATTGISAATTRGPRRNKTGTHACPKWRGLPAGRGAKRPPCCRRPTRSPAPFGTQRHCVRVSTRYQGAPP